MLELATFPEVLDQEFNMLPFSLNTIGDPIFHWNWPTSLPNKKFEVADDTSRALTDWYERFLEFVNPFSPAKADKSSSSLKSAF